MCPCAMTTWVSLTTPEEERGSKDEIEAHVRKMGVYRNRERQ